MHSLMFSVNYNIVIISITFECSRYQYYYWENMVGNVYNTTILTDIIKQWNTSSIQTVCNINRNCYQQRIITEEIVTQLELYS